MAMIGNKPWRDIKPDAQAFDEVRITTVPRYKESGLSGDEWRISAKVQLLRKGKVIVEKGFRNVETACAHLIAFHGEACDAGNACFAGEGDFCDQEGCSELATVTYAKKANYCRDGHKSELTHTTIRRFCERHKTRGDCGLDDADSNYELFDPLQEPKQEPPIHSKDKLAAALKEAGLQEMADLATTGYYHDFMSPLATPCLQLAADLQAAGTPAALALRGRVINGEFDATNEESEKWAESPEGQEAFAKLASQR